MRGFHARELQKFLVRAIVEGDLFLSARSSSFLLLSLESCLKISIVVGKKRCFREGSGRRGGPREGKMTKNEKMN